MKATSNSLLAVVENAGDEIVELAVDPSFEVFASIAIGAMPVPVIVAV